MSDSNKKFWESLWEKMGSIYEIYFQTAEVSKRMRFFWAWLGSLTLYMPLFTFHPEIRKALNKPMLVFLDNINGNPYIIITILICLFTSLAVGGMIATSNDRYGPVRLYLSGLMLSSLIVIVVTLGYSFWISNAVPPSDPQTMEEVIERYGPSLEEYGHLLEEYGPLLAKYGR